MRLLLSSEHRYPAYRSIGQGPHPMKFPSGSGYMIHDLLAKGLAELGHDVFYLLRQGAAKPLPKGVKFVSKPTADADIVHTIADHDKILNDEREACRKPWVTTCHLDLRVKGMPRVDTTENWIFVSRTLARVHGRSRYVLNGIDPAEYIYNESKDNYFLFMSTLDWGREKGLDIALSLAKQIGFKLVVAGTGRNYRTIRRVAELCRDANAKFVGDVRGKQKAELLAGARAFLFPTKVNEAFGLGMAEALMSGTPVICSNRGACPEVISRDVGIVCKNVNEYFGAVFAISAIRPRACREKAMKEYHYLRMAADYVIEYQKEIARNGHC